MRIVKSDDLSLYMSYKEAEKLLEELDRAIIIIDSLQKIPSDILIKRETKDNNIT